MKRSTVGGLLASGVPALMLLAAACAPAQSGGGGRAAENAPPTIAPKIVTMALGTEPTSFGAIGATEPPIGQHSNVLRIVQDDLMSRTEGGGTEARLASEAPSTDRGTWKINADGTMDTTFKLRSGIRWHDGAPFTSADALFA